MDITPLIPKGKQIITSYGNGGFTVNDGDHYKGSIILFPDKVLPWDIKSLPSLTAALLAPITQHADDVEILLLGCGAEHGMVTAEIRRELKASHGIVVDSMDTGAACRTYNVLLSEERRVAAALIAV